MSPHLHFPRNELGRDFIVGDLHGCFDMLERLLLSARFEEGLDRLFCVGDLVDRGPQSRDVVALLDKPWFHAVRGNHEAMLLGGFLRNEAVASHILNGGGWFYELPKRDQIEIGGQIAALPLAITIDTTRGPVGIVHAECPVDDWQEFVGRLEEEPIEHAALWSRRRIGKRIATPITNVHQVYSGHTIVPVPVILGNSLWIDTGAYRDDGGLTMAQLTGTAPRFHCVAHSRGHGRRTMERRA